MVQRYSRSPRWAFVLLAVVALALVGLNVPTTQQIASAQPLLPPVRPAPDWSASHAAGQLLVKLADFSLLGAQSLQAQTGLPILRSIPQLGIVVIAADGAATGEALAATAARLELQRNVEWVEPNYTFALDLVPNDPSYASRQATYMNRMEMPAAWDYTTGQPGVVVAVLDTGVDLTHPDLAGNIWTNPLEIPTNLIDDDGNGFVDDVYGWNFASNNNAVADDYGHGTHVAGIAAAAINNATGIAGMAGGAKIMAVKVFYPPPSVIGTYEDLIRGIVYATDNGARVINMSLGATSYSLGEEAAVDYAWEHGVVVAAAAGNSGRDIVHYPAAHPNAMAVAATDAGDNRASFSNWGDFVDIAAPGVSVYSTVRFGGYSTMSGTSMATPHVAGLAALLFSLNPQLTNTQVRTLIEQNADDLGGKGWDPYYGYGRINGRKALAAVAPPPQPSPSPTPHAPLVEWPEGCRDLFADGDFEEGLGGWQAAGTWAVDTGRAYSGTHAVHFTGGPDAKGVLTRTLDLAAGARAAGTFPHEATLWFAYRIENQDHGFGTSPDMPFDDLLTAEFRAPEGEVITSLLRTGNSADTASSGLPWDRYVYRMRPADLVSIGMLGKVDLVFHAVNDADSLPTDFWVDAVRLCVTWGEPPPLHIRYLPLILN